MRPLTVLLSASHGFLMESCFVSHQQQMALAKKVAILFVAMLLLPLTLLGLAIGSVLLTASKSHRLHASASVLADKIRAAVTGLTAKVNEDRVRRELEVYKDDKTLYYRQLAVHVERTLGMVVPQAVKTCVEEARPLIEELYGRNAVMDALKDLVKEIKRAKQDVVAQCCKRWAETVSFLRREYPEAATVIRLETGWNEALNHEIDEILR